MSVEQRKAELDAKRAKLEKIREEKKNRTMPSTPMTPSGQVSTTPSTASSEIIDPDKIMAEAGLTQLPAPVRPSLSTSPGSAAAVSSSTQPKRRPPAAISLQICQQSSATISVPPKELVTYSKEVQTVESGDKDPTASPIQHEHLQWDDEFPLSTTDGHNRLVYVSDDDTMSLDDNTKPSMGMSMSSATEFKRTRSLKQHKQMSLQGQASLNKAEFTNEEREQVLKSEPFQNFFARSSRIIERSLWESPHAFDIFKDYSGADLDEQNGRMDVGEIIKFDREFFDERWSRHRIVTCIDTSTYHPELVLASYSQNDESTHESDGVVLIWNTKYKSKPTPEVRFLKSDLADS